MKLRPQGGSRKPVRAASRIFVEARNELQAAKHASFLNFPQVQKEKARDRGRVAGQRTVTLLGGIRWDGATFSTFISPTFFELAST